VVYYDVGGTAALEDRVEPLNGQTTIPDGQMTRTLALTPDNDPLVESDESVIITLLPDPAYEVGVPGSATALIVDTDMLGDFDESLVLDETDLGMLYDKIGGNDPVYDLNGDGGVDTGDVDVWINELFATGRSDFSLDYRTNFTDFVILAAYYGQTKCTFLEGDTNNDWGVDFTDFVRLAAEYGQTWREHVE
jgi:hypothetical protein